MARVLSEKVFVLAEEKRASVRYNEKTPRNPDYPKGHYVDKVDLGEKPYPKEITVTVTVA